MICPYCGSRKHTRFVACSELLSDDLDGASEILTYHCFACEKSFRVMQEYSLKLIKREYLKGE